MARIAIIEHGAVANVIEADSEELAAQLTGLLSIQSNEAAIGWFYNEENGEFSEPPVFEEPEVLPLIVAEDVASDTEPVLLSRPTED